MNNTINSFLTTNSESVNGGINMNYQSKKHISAATLATEPESSDIQSLHNILSSGEDLSLNADGTLSREADEDKPQKKGKIPKNVLGGEDEDQPVASDDAAEAKDNDKKKNKIPKCIVGFNLREELSRRINPHTKEDEAQDDAENASEESSEEAPKKNKIPKNVLGAPVQWYSKPENRQLLELEIAAMKEFVGEPSWGNNCGVLDDGRMYWRVKQRIKADGRNGKPIYDTTYNMLLVYQPDHPNCNNYGSSVRTYLISPTVTELQSKVYMSHVMPKTLNHVLTDNEGNTYLCNISTGDFNTPEGKGICTAKTALLAAVKWLHNFEVGIRCQEHWNLFQKHRAL